MISPTLQGWAQDLASLVLPAEPDDDALAPPVPAAMQLLVPSSPWNWPTDSNGTSSAALYEFCSWTPSSASTAEAFAPSSTRFSDGYRLFLDCLQPDAVTAAALAAFADDSTYTTVLYAQSRQPRLPAWNVAESPEGWVASVSGGSSTAGTVRLQLPDAGEEAGPIGSTCFAVVGDDGTTVPLVSPPGAGQWVEVTADAWGLVPVRPAGWFDGAVVGLKASGPYSTGGAGTFFGAGGAIRALLTGLCVALHPTVQAEVSSALATTVGSGLSRGASLQIGGLVLDEVAVGRSPSPEGLVSLAGSSASDVVIVGVTVAALGVGA